MTPQKQTTTLTTSNNNNFTGMVCLAKRNTVYVGWDPKRRDMHYDCRESLHILCLLQTLESNGKCRSRL